MSTKLEAQANSLEVQQAAYRDFISRQPDWVLAGIYADNLSGRSAQGRPEFMRMLEDAKQGKIDRILCKSVSRFSRNVAECKRYTDMLMLKNVAVEFEKEHLRTDDPTGSFVFSLMSAIAEDESRSISENVKWAYRQRVKRGEYHLGNNRILGYDWLEGKLVPNASADTVRLIFELYLQGAGLKNIADQLKALGRNGRSGKPLTEQGILYILGNEAYVGDKMLQKQPPKDFLTKQPDMHCPFENNYLVHDHEALIDRQTWEATRERLAKRRSDIDSGLRRHSRAHFLYGKLYCGGCGAPMIRRTVTGSNPYKSWVCREHLLGQNGNGCPAKPIRETVILEQLPGKADPQRIPEEIERIDIWMNEVTVISAPSKNPAPPILTK